MTIPMRKADIIPIAPAVPFNEQAERGALAAMLNNMELVVACAWPEELFFQEVHKTLLESLKRTHASGGRDVFAVQADLQARGLLETAVGIDLITEIVTSNKDESYGNAMHHRELLVKSARYRAAMQAVREMERDILEQKADILGLSTKLADAATLHDRPSRSLKDVFNDLIADLEGNEDSEAFTTALPALDEITNGGPKRGELAVVAAETSGGKSILLVQTALANVLQDKAVVFFSLEMPAKQVLERFVSNFVDANVRKAVESRSKEGIAKLTNAIAALQNKRLQIESEYSDLESIEAKIRELHKHGKADLVCVDYLQLVHLRAMGKNDTREQHVSEIARRLKSLALQLNISIFTASQLNDEGKLRESRAIGMHSDHVWKVAHTDDGSFIGVFKNRAGARGSAVPVVMHGATSKFIPRTK